MTQRGRGKKARAKRAKIKRARSDRAAVGLGRLMRARRNGHR